MIFDLTPIQWLVLAIGAVSTLFGLLIGYQAYRGFRRHAERSMQFLSLGLILLTAIPYTVSLTGTFLIQAGFLSPALRTPIVGVGAQLIQLVGLVCITYSLYTRS